MLSGQDCRSCKSSQRRKEFFYNRTKQPLGVSHNENFTNILVRVTKSSKFQALRMQLLVTAISTQIFSENTILLALHEVKKFLYLDLIYPGGYWVIRQQCLITPVRPDFKRFTHANTSRAWVAVKVFEPVLLYKLMLENKVRIIQRN